MLKSWNPLLLNDKNVASKRRKLEQPVSELSLENPCEVPAKARNQVLEHTV